MLSRIPLITGLIASLAFAGMQQAQAADRGDVAAGVAVGAILGGVLASQRTVRVYEPAPVYYAPPVVVAPPVVYGPPRVYAPAPRVVITPPPVYVRPPHYHAPRPHYQVHPSGAVHIERVRPHREYRREYGHPAYGRG